MTPFKISFIALSALAGAAGIGWLIKKAVEKSGYGHFSRLLHSLTLWSGLALAGLCLIPVGILVFLASGLYSLADRALGYLDRRKTHA